MIEHMLDRKDETICKGLNKENIAHFLASCIPIESYEELKQKADLYEDPVKILFRF